jgi:hypothetical protein
MKLFSLLFLMPILAYSQNIKVTDNMVKCEVMASDNPDDIKHNIWYQSSQENVGTVYMYRVKAWDGLEKFMTELETLLELNDKKFKSPDIDESIGKFDPKKLKESSQEIAAGGLYVKKVWLQTPGDKTGDYIMMVSDSGIVQLVVMDVK